MRRNKNPKSREHTMELIAAAIIMIVIQWHWSCESTRPGASRMLREPREDAQKYQYIEPVEVELDMEVTEETIVEEIVFHEAPDEEVIDEIALQPQNTEEYAYLRENPFQSVLTHPMSTFSIDVDNASYANVRRFLQNNQLPPPDAVRIEEMINYFHYDYPDPKPGQPFSIYTEVGPCPWNPTHQLVHIGLQGRKLDYEDRRPSNIIFLIDVSGSMGSPNKLPLAQRSLKMLSQTLQAQDRVAIVVYASSSGVVLPSTPAGETETIQRAIASLTAGGSTAGGAGIEQAYEIAEQNFIPEGNNRIVLLTDGDFNVGPSSTGDLVRLIEEKRKSKIFLTICGFGMGNYKDHRMEEISNAGNGNYFYIDNIREAEKVFNRELTANLFTIAKDVKVQAEFNPALVSKYRLIGYENRALAPEDFEDDQRDAGELGAGHTVTCLYEIIPGEAQGGTTSRYISKSPTSAADTNELLTVNLRYKEIDSEVSQLIVRPVTNEAQTIAAASEDYRFSAAVAAFGQVLRRSRYATNLTLTDIESLAEAGSDDEKQEFFTLVRTARLLQNLK